jgi:DNA polymerase III beta subunit
MSLTTQTTALRNALGSLTKVIPTATSLPILTCVHLKSVALQGLVLEATNLEMGLRLHLPGADADFEAAVLAKTLAEVVASIEAETVKLSVEDSKVLVTAKGVKAKIAALDPGEFPPMPNCTHEAITISAPRLKAALKKVVFAASNDQSRPALACVQLAAKGDDKLTLAAADGFRLAVQELEGRLDLPSEVRQQLVIPAPSLKKLIAMLPDDETEFVTLSVNAEGSQALFAWNGAEVFISLADYAFPDWKAIVPETVKHEISLPADFAGAVKRAEVFGKLGNHVVTLLPEDQGMSVRGHSEEAGESKTVLEGVTLPFKVSFNAIFVAQGLEAIGPNQVHLHLNTPSAPAMLTNGSREYLYLVMPMADFSPQEKERATAAAEQSAAAEGQD